MNKKKSIKSGRRTLCLLDDESKGKVNCKYDEMIPTPRLIKKMMMILMMPIVCLSK